MKNSSYKIVIDKFGRVLIPKKVRTNLCLTPGSVLEIEEKETGVTIHPAVEKPILITKEGVLVARCHPIEPLKGFEKKLRSQRIQKFTGSLR